MGAEERLIFYLVMISRGCQVNHYNLPNLLVCFLSLPPDLSSKSGEHLICGCAAY